MNKLTATIVKKLAADLGLKLTGNFKNGYKVTVENTVDLIGCNTLYETFAFNAKELEDVKVYNFLKGVNILNNGDEKITAAAWATFRLLDAKKYAEEVVNSPAEKAQFEAEWDGVDIASWEQNEEETAYEVCPDNNVLVDAYHFYDNKMEYVINQGEKDDDFWNKYILNNAE